MTVTILAQELGPCRPQVWFCASWVLAIRRPSRLVWALVRVPYAVYALGEDVRLAAVRCVVRFQSHSGKLALSCASAASPPTSRILGPPRDRIDEPTRHRNVRLLEGSGPFNQKFQLSGREAARAWALQCSSHQGFNPETPNRSRAIIRAHLNTFKFANYMVLPTI